MPETADARSLDVELRHVADPDRLGPGRIEGVLMPADGVARSRRERFRAAGLSWPADGIVIHRQHDRRAPIMRTVPIRGENGDVLVSDELPDTAAGRDAAAEMRSGLLRGLSVEFRAVAESRGTDGRRVVERAELAGAGLVTAPDYDAPVSVRDEDPEPRLLAWM